MEIDINQAKIAIRDTYKIFTDGQLTHTAKSVLFRFLSKINLFEITYGSEARMTLIKRFAILKPKYDIKCWDKSVLKFRAKTIYRSYFQCQCGRDIYDIYGHDFRKYSIFKNTVQVAWWEKKAVTWFAGDNYRIIADRDIDFNLIISFCIIIDNCSSKGRANIVSFDLGAIGVEEREFDTTWQPKS